MINLLSHTHVKKIEEVNIAFWVREKYMCKLLNTIFHLIQGFLGSFSSFSHLNGVFFRGNLREKYPTNHVISHNDLPLDAKTFNAHDDKAPRAATKLLPKFPRGKF